MTGLNIRGHVFDVDLNGSAYTVRCGGQEMQTDLPKTLMFSAQDQQLCVVN